MSSFFEYVGQCMPQLTLGLKLTLQMTVFSLILAVVVGMVMCLFSISKVKPLNWISGIYLSLIRGTPLMVQAFFIYFGITGALHIRITSFSAAILVLCLNAGAYLSEIFRSGIGGSQQRTDGSSEKLGLALWCCDEKNHPAASNPYRNSFCAEPVYHHFEGYLYPFCYRLWRIDASRSVNRIKKLSEFPNLCDCCGYVLCCCNRADKSIPAG